MKSDIGSLYKRGALWACPLSPNLIYYIEVFINGHLVLIEPRAINLLAIKGDLIFCMFRDMSWFSLKLTTWTRIGSYFEFKNGRVNASPSLKCALMCWNAGALPKWSDAPTSLPRPQIGKTSKVDKLQSLWVSLLNLWFFMIPFWDGLRNFLKVWIGMILSLPPTSMSCILWLLMI